MASVICLDFDDTIVLDNMTRAIFAEFGGSEVTELEAAYQRGELTVEQYNAKAFDTVDAPAETMAAFARERARVREGLLELGDWAHWNGWQCAVVSNGLDLYVNPILDDVGLDRMPRHCGRTRFRYRWHVRYLSPRGFEVEEGFKTAYVEAYREAGDLVAYVGDGHSDIEAARLAHHVFARSTLWEALHEEHASIHPFETFHDVVATLETEAPAWQRSFWSTTAAAGS